MTDEFKIEIINPDQLFYSNENIFEAVIPAFEGEIGILKDHISIISFLKPGIIKLKLNNSAEETFYVEDGIIEFKDNLLSILTSNIVDLKKTSKDYFDKSLKEAQKILEDTELSDQERFLNSQKVDTLKSLN